MNSKVPTIRQIAWISIIPQLVIMISLVFLWKLFEVEDPLIYGIITFLILSIVLRTFIPRDHRNGMKLVKQEKFSEAIAHFEKSYEYFKNNEWLDKYRSLTILSSSSMCYKEMALNNIAFCYGQIGNGMKSKEYYEKTLKEYPENGLAKAGLKLLNSVDNMPNDNKSGL